MTKKVLFVLLWLSVLIFLICNIYANKQPGYVSNIDYVVEQAIEQHEECSHFWNAKTFINYDVLRVWIWDNWNIEYNILASGRWYHVDERGNINSDCSFSAVPIVVEISEDENWYSVNYYGSERDTSNYKKFIKDNFSWGWYKVRQDIQRNSVKGKIINTLSMAEDYFWIKIYQDKYFECSFCDTARYYYDTIKNKTWDIVDLYGIEPLNKDYIIFNSDWTAQRFGDKNSWKFARYFGKDSSTLILKNDKAGQTLERLIIDELKSDEISFISEKIEVYQ